jgi:hypothetical protein
MRKTFVGFVLIFSVYQVYAAEVATLEMQSSKNDEASVTSTNIITIDDKKLRIDYLGSETEKTIYTPYLLTLNAGKKWIMGDLEKDEFYCADVDMKELFRDIGNIISDVDTLVNPDIYDTKVELLLEEAGPEILGYATTHIRIKTTAKAKASVMFKKYNYGITSVDDVWYTNDRKEHKAKKRWLKALTHTGYDELDKLSRAFRSEIDGPILMHDIVVETTNYKLNKVDTYTRNIRVVSLEKMKSSEVPENTFSEVDCKKINKRRTREATKSMVKKGKLTL